MSTVVIIVVGVAVFTLSTMASLWVGYLVFQRAWATENTVVRFDGERIRPLAGRYRPRSGGRSVRVAKTVST